MCGCMARPPAAGLAEEAALAEEAQPVRDLVLVVLEDLQLSLHQHVELAAGLALLHHRLPVERVDRLRVVAQRADDLVGEAYS